MKTIKLMQQDVNALTDELGKMRELCTQENRTPTNEEVEWANKKIDEIEALEANIELEKRTQGMLDRSKEPEVPPERTDVNTEQRTLNQREHFASDGEFYQAVMRAGSPGGIVDPRLTTRAASGLSESVPSDGGFLVESEMANEILKNVWDTGVILPRVSKVTLGGNATGMKFNGMDETSRADGSRAGGIRAYWAAEAAEKTASKPKFRQIELSLNKLIGLCYATDELLEDANALAATITEGFKRRVRFQAHRCHHQRFTGAGQPLGILNSGLHGFGDQGNRSGG